MKLNYRRTILTGLAFMAIYSFWQTYDNIVPLILKNSFGMNEIITGVVMAADNVLALFLLPLFGTLSDKVDTKWGKRMPFIIGGTALTVVAIAFMPIGDNTRNLPPVFDFHRLCVAFYGVLPFAYSSLDAGCDTETFA